MLAVGKIKWHLTLGKKLSYSETFGHMKLVVDGTYGMVFENNSRLHHQSVFTTQFADNN